MSDDPPTLGSSGAREPDPATLLEGDLRSALRVLECADPARPRLGHGVRLVDEIVRLSQSVSLGFDGESLAALERVGGVRPWHLHVRHPGLFGQAGPLPLHLTEEADRRARHDGDRTLREFVDRFNHRLLALFYRAWADAEPVIAGDRPAENPFADMLGAFGGFGEGESRDRDAVPDAVRQGSALWFGRQARSPDGLVAVLARHLDIDAEVVELTGGWVALPGMSRLALRSEGRARAVLGERLLGRRAWCADGAFRLVVRVRSRERFAALSGSGDALGTLDDVVRTYVGDALDWELELALDDGVARPLALGRDGRLGRESWLLSPSVARPRDCRLRLDAARRRRLRAVRDGRRRAESASASSGDPASGSGAERALGAPSAHIDRVATPAGHDDASPPEASRPGTDRVPTDPATAEPSTDAPMSAGSPPDESPDDAWAALEDGEPPDADRTAASGTDGAGRDAADARATAPPPENP